MTCNFKFTLRFVLCFMVLFSALGINKALASHYAAADMYVDYIGSGPTNLKYRVTLIIYKACEPNNASLGSESINIQSTLGGYNISRLEQLPPLDTLDQLCGPVSAINSCRVPSSIYPGYVRAVFVDTFTVPVAARDTRFFWTSGSRNAAIANLLSPGGQSIYIECNINNAARYNNSSPRYTAAAIPYICINQHNFYQNVPYDPDGDSLATFNWCPENAQNSCIPYTTTPNPPNGPAITPYSSSNPIDALMPAGYNVNVNTGAANFTPVSLGKYVLAFRTYEMDPYTHDTMGYITRDVQVSVLTCAGAPPTIDTIPLNTIGGTVIDNNGNPYVNTCPNEALTFTVNTTSNNPVASIVMTSNNTISCPGSSFTYVQNPGGSVATFNWTPQITDIGNHLLLITARDSTCNNGQPIITQSFLVLTIKVLPGLDAGPDGKVCPLGDHAYQLKVSGPSTSTYNWTDLNGNTAQYLSCTTCPNPLATPPIDYTYVVSSPDPLFVCKNRDTVNVVVDHTNGIVIDGNMTQIVCRPGYVNLHATGTGSGPITNLPCGTNNLQTCTTPDSIVIGGGVAAASNTANTPFYSNNVYQKYQFVVSRAELLNAGLYSGTLSSIAFLSIVNQNQGTQPLANVNISLKCSNRSAYPSNGAGNNDFETGTTLVATVPSYTITPGTWNKINFSQNYNWDTTQNLIVDICIGPMNPANTNGLDPVAVVPGSAIQRYDDNTDVCSNFAATVNSYTQRPVVRFGYCAAPELPFVYNWAPGTFVNDSNAQGTYAYVANTETFFAYTRGKNGCLVKDTVVLFVPDHHLSVTPQDTFICAGEHVKLHATGAKSGYTWLENGAPAASLDCNTCAEPLATPNGTTTYTVIFNDQYDDGTNCMDTMTTTVNVWPLPPVHIVNNDTLIMYGQHVDLMANGAYNYSWTPAGSLTDPNSPNPVASPTVSTRYIVYGIDRNNCQSTDTVQVNVNPHNSLMVPSGFTPNGDGVNDEFKIVNLTFERVMEFRVFNRWGQQVFSTEDGHKGWDGRWKNVPQDIGNYQYIIRIGFPDGFVETYKGDVTLIR